ncbi:MAG: aminofutalosine synthase MqnE [Planctomycetota bacterium]
MLVRSDRRHSLAEISAKVHAGERLGYEDGVALFKEQNLHAVGRLANHVREQKNGNDAYFIFNRHLNPTNICVLTCSFCAFAKRPGEAGGYRMSLDQIRAKVRDEFAPDVQEIHIVGGLDPKLPYQYHLDVLRVVKEERPHVHVKAYTMIEIEWLKRIGKKTVHEVLDDLKQAGLDSCPGGGAEVLSARVHAEIFPDKLDARQWIEMARTVHRAGIRSNATMLYGHIETIEELVEHLLLVRELQDETQGFLTFIPLAFHPQHTALAHLPGPSAQLDLRVIAVARLMLDNFDHVKTYWIMQSLPLSQVALWYGADDIDGTVIEEKITHDAGATTPQGVTRDQLIALIREAGRAPVERDTLYTRLKRY